MKTRTIAFGDIHGDSRALKVLLDQINPQPCDHLIFLGDVIDRGLDTKGVIERIIDLSKKTKVSVIIGNHEEKCLEGFAKEPPELSAWLWMGGQSALDSYENGVMPKEHLDFLAGVNYVETEDFIFLHAYFSNSYRLEDTPTRILRWEFLPENHDAIMRHWSAKTVVCGHTTVGENALDLGHLIAIDTGAGSENGWLTAFDTAGLFHSANEQGAYRSYARGYGNPD